MRVLLTNDDGLKSPGLTALRRAFEPDHEIWIVAPDGQRSGCSQSITLRSSIRTTREEERVFSCSGTPVDCVNIAYTRLLPSEPDLIVSGINLGPNIGTDIGYSGTAAAARQGAYWRIPSIAISVFGRGPVFHFGAAVTFLTKHLEEMTETCTPEFFFNVNVPDTDSEVAEISVCDIAESQYDSAATSFSAPNGDRYHFYEGELITTGIPEGTDLHAILQNRITVSFVRSIPGVTVQAGVDFLDMIGRSALQTGG